MVSTLDDSVVDVEYTRRLFQTRFMSPDKRLLLYGNSQSIKAKPNEIIRPSAYLVQRILNQSHLSLVNSAHNPLFGKDASVLVCNGHEYPTALVWCSAFPKSRWCCRSPQHLQP